MRVVVALGGNALLKRGEPMTADVQRENVKIAAQALAPVAQEHELVLSHGNGPQVGLLALQSDAYKEVEADMYVMATNVDGVNLYWGTPDARKIDCISHAEQELYDFAAGSMRPRVATACAFARVTGNRAAIGALADITAIVAGKAGTIVEKG